MEQTCLKNITTYVCYYTQLRVVLHAVQLFFLTQPVALYLEATKTEVI